MSIFNRRYAVLGWLTWQGAKTIGKRKARQAVPAIEDKKPNKGAIAAALATVAGVLFFWRKSRHRGEQPE
jgi:hypothetical protein